MARTNLPAERVRTHEGAPAYPVNPTLELRRSLMACLLWEKTFYEDGEDIADRIARLVPLVSGEDAAVMALEARNDMKLRHAPLWVAVAMARAGGDHRSRVADLLEQIIQRPDELCEVLALYARDRTGAKRLGKLSHQIQKGVARAFRKFDGYQLAKYDRPAEIRLRDALFLSHAKPKDEAQAETWRQLIAGTLPAPDTWEVALSSGADKRATWERLLAENKLGALALLRNLRNMLQAGVSPSVIGGALAEMRVDRVLPFRFISAAVHAPQLEPALEEAMKRAAQGQPMLTGRTAILVDHSGSMTASLSAKSELSRFDGAAALAMLARELCEEVRVFAFSDAFVEIPPRRGFALRDAIRTSMDWNCTYLGQAVREVAARYRTHDRLIAITDEQSHDAVGPPPARGYMVNVGTFRHGVGYGPWTHIDGWSESILRYVAEAEPSA